MPKMSLNPVALRPGCETLDRPDANGIADADEYNGDHRCLTFRRQRRARSARYQHFRTTLYHLSHDLVGLTGDPANIKHDISIFNQSNLA